MQKIDFPRLKTPARVNLDATATADMLRQYAGAGEYKLWTLGLHSLVALQPENSTVREASRRLDSVIDRQLHRTVVDTIRDVAPYVHWRQTREIYEVHPSMTRALAGMSSKTVIPGSIFRRLRHPNPLFITTAGTPFTHPDGYPGRVLGFFVTGAFANGYPKAGDEDTRVTEPDGKLADRRAAVLLDTHDPQANALHAVVVSEVLNAERAVLLDIDMCHLTLPMTTDFTLDGLVEEIGQGGFRYAQAMEPPVEGGLDGYLGSMARFVITHLLYACSRTSEIGDGKNDRPPARQRKGKAGQRPEKPAKVHKVGYRVGAKIEDNMRWAREQRESGASTGRRLPPHMRAAHAHLYRVGQGRREIDIKFLDPIPVNMKDDDGVTATLHPMGEPT